MIGVSLPGGSIATYKYDAFGRRIDKTVDGITTEFLWQGERLNAESAVNRYRTYIYEPDSFRPLAMLDGEGPLRATPFYYQLDHLGTPQELTDYSGEIMWSGKYRAHGNLATLDVAEIDNPLRFQGQYFDTETGLHYNRHRYYNPGTGRFLTPDPIKLAGGLNNYQYVPNPTGWVDPLGLSGNCPDADKKLSLAETPDSSSGSNVYAAGPATPPAPANPPGQGYHNEVYASKPVKPQDAAGKWHDFLGEGPYTNIHPRTGLPDNDRLVSADGKRSIRYGAHEMNSKPNKHHYHEETWTLDLINNVMNIDNTVVRVPLGTK